MTYVQCSEVHSYDLMVAGVVLLCACVCVPSRTGKKPEGLVRKERIAC